MIRRFATIGLALILAACHGNSREQFDRASWLATNTDTSSRAPIAEVLVHSGRLQGMSRDEVIRMLGEPTETGHFQGTDLIYVLGPERGYMSIDYEWLLIDLDGAGRVRRARVTTD